MSTMLLRSRHTLVQCIDATGKSERAIAREAEVGHATLNHLVSGRRTTCTAETAEKIAKALEVPVNALFTHLSGDWSDPGTNG